MFILTAQWVCYLFNTKMIQQLELKHISVLVFAIFVLKRGFADKFIDILTLKMQNHNWFLFIISFSFTQVPYEILNKKFRTAQKTLDREVSHVQQAAVEIEKTLECPVVRASDITSLLGGMVEKLQVLKRKGEYYGCTYRNLVKINDNNIG